MTSSKPAAAAAIVLGTLAVAAIPAGVGAAQLSQRLGLLQTLYVVVPAAVLLGLLALAAARRARRALLRSVRGDSARLVRVARLVAWFGAYAGITGALALGVFGLLRAAQ